MFSGKLTSSSGISWLSNNFFRYFQLFAKLTALFAGPQPQECLRLSVLIASHWSFNLYIFQTLTDGCCLSTPNRLFINSFVKCIFKMLVSFTSFAFVPFLFHSKGFFCILDSRLPSKIAFTPCLLSCLAHFFSVLYVKAHSVNLDITNLLFPLQKAIFFFLFSCALCSIVPLNYGMFGKACEILFQHPCFFNNLRLMTVPDFAPVNL